MSLKSGKILLFTDADEDMFFDNQIYVCGSYFTPNKVFSSNELAEDNFIISGIIDGKFIKREDLILGDFADCYIEIFLVDIYAPCKKKIALKTGWFGEIKFTRNHFVAQINSLSSKTNNIVGQCYSSSCRAEFADQYCKLNKEEYLTRGSITELAGANSFLDTKRQEPEEYYSKGILTFTSGKNEGRKFNINSYQESKITLDSIFDSDLEIGDEYIIIAGCNKALSTCINKFNNAINFRGEPFIPNKSKLVVG
jgi:uncharacterized phage protein (TIGR02218 family)